jgi:phage host-nuclease inhibitor protein Gam
LKKGKQKMSELTNVVADDFRIDTDAKAEWALKKIAEARADRDRWVAWYTDKIAEIKAQTDFDTMNLENMLAEYFATVPHKVTKTQESYKLPGGKLILKTQNPEYKKDEATVIEWLKKNDMAKYVKVEEKLDWAELKSATEVFEGHIVTEDGEIIPGIDVVDREAKFVVEV